MDAWAIRYPTFTPDVADVIRDLTLRHLAGASITGLRHWSGEEPMTNTTSRSGSRPRSASTPRSSIDQPTDATPRPYDCPWTHRARRGSITRRRSIPRCAPCARCRRGWDRAPRPAHARCAAALMNVRDIAEDARMASRVTSIRESAGVRRNGIPRQPAAPSSCRLEDHSMAKPIIKTNRRATECVPGFPAWTRSMHFDHATIVTDDIDVHAAFR